MCIKTKYVLTLFRRFEVRWIHNIMKESTIEVALYNVSYSSAAIVYVSRKFTGSVKRTNIVAFIYIYIIHKR